MHSRTYVCTCRSTGSSLTQTLRTHIGELRSYVHSRNERNTSLAFPYFYVTRDPEPLCSPTLCNFTGWFWSSPCLSFISGHPRRSKHRHRIDVRKRTARSHRCRRREFFREVTRLISRQAESKMRFHTVPVSVLQCIRIYFCHIRCIHKILTKFLVRSVVDSVF